MNLLLLATLVVSGAVELVVGLSALLVPTRFARTWLGVVELSDPLRILLFALAWAGLGLAALHVLAIRWLKDEKSEGYAISIALGGGIALFGVLTFIYAQMRATTVANTAAILVVDGFRGLFLGLAAVLAMNAPRTVKELRLPTQREASRMRSRRESDVRHSRGRPEQERRRGRRRDRRGESGGSAPGRDRPAMHGTPAGREGRDDRRRDRPQVGGTEDSRRQRPLSGPPAATESRSLGVVVTGRPPQGGPVPAERSRSGAPEAGGVEERNRLPRQPMVPRLRTDIGERSDRGRETPSDDRERPEGHEERRRRRRRRRSSSRMSDERAPNGSESPSPRVVDRDIDRGVDRRVDRGVDRSMDRVADRNVGRNVDRDMDREEIDAPAPSSVSRRLPIERPVPIEQEPSAPAPVIHEAPDFQEEPIDRISSFVQDRSTEQEPSATRSDFGRTTRPFTPHRKGRQVKPREQKIHRSLGGDSTQPEDPSALQTPPRRIAVEGQIGMADGIGPIDLDEEPGDSGRT